MYRPVGSDRMSIFGDTYDGVPNPLVPHLHPYPTRYHGPILNQPQATLPYRPTPYSRPPYVAEAKPLAPWERALGQEPDVQAEQHANLLAEGEDVFLSGQLATTMVLRGAVGVAVGAAVAPEGKEALWAAIGFAMGATVGEVGIVGLALARVWGKSQ